VNGWSRGVEGLRSDELLTPSHFPGGAIADLRVMLVRRHF
jgi:hypothetical protein